MEAPTQAVRGAEPSDVPRLARLRYQFRAAEDPAVEEREDFLERCEAWMRERVGDASGRWRSWVIVPDDRVRGHVWVQLFPKVPNPAEESETHAYLTNTYVEPGHRGHGLGTALVEVAVRWCRGEEVDSLILWPTEGTRALYRRFGSVPAGGVFELDLGGG